MSGGGMGKPGKSLFSTTNAQESNRKTVYKYVKCYAQDCEDGTVFQTDFGMGGCWNCHYCRGTGKVLKETKETINEHLTPYIGK
jgi:hypothetical protein